MILRQLNVSTPNRYELKDVGTLWSDLIVELDTDPGGWRPHRWSSVRIHVVDR